MPRFPSLVDGSRNFWAAYAVMLALADEVRRRFFPNTTPLGTPMKPMLKVPLSMRIEWVQARIAAEIAEEGE